MEITIIISFAVLGVLIGIVLGYLLRWLVALGKKSSIELKVKQMMLEARDEAKRITEEAGKKAEEITGEAKKSLKETEEQLRQKEDHLLKKEETLDKRQTDLDKEQQESEEKEAAIKEQEEILKKAGEEQQAALEKVAGLTTNEAKEALMESIGKNYEEDLLVRLHKLEEQGEERFETKAKGILTAIVQRLGNSMSSDVLATSVSIPNDEIKGKIIGKEGRNIKAFEKETGVEVIVDDTPGVITISSFDPVRRQIARFALENLILDGRIQPARIEDEVKKAKEEVNKIIKEKGEQAAYECGVFNLDPRIIAILGRLYFRTSYGQNVLEHSVEISHLSGMLAEELGADVSIAKAGGLLHDIGKAVDHEVQGTHVEIGRRILQKFGADERITKAMEAHHEEYPYETLESRIVQTADAVSGGRPGARKDNVEQYIKRLSELEAIANAHKGVEKTFALQAGREIRVFVRPENVNDIEAKQMARDIAVQIENDLKYPGEIKVSVIRESRVIEYAR